MDFLFSFLRFLSLVKHLNKSCKVLRTLRPVCRRQKIRIFNIHLFRNHSALYSRYNSDTFKTNDEVKGIPLIELYSKTIEDIKSTHSKCFGVKCLRHIMTDVTCCFCLAYCTPALNKITSSKMTNIDSRVPDDNRKFVY
jgi:hypothetical protein